MLHLLLQTFLPWQNGKILCISHFIPFWILWNLIFRIFWPKFWNLGLELNLYCPLKLICVTFIVANILAFTECKNVMYFSFYTILNFVKFGFWHFLAQILKFVPGTKFILPTQVNLCYIYCCKHFGLYRMEKYYVFLILYYFEFCEICFLAFFGLNFKIWARNWIYIAYSS